jgi:hypothetical protein
VFRRFWGVKQVDSQKQVIEAFGAIQNSRLQAGFDFPVANWQQHP